MTFIHPLSTFNEKIEGSDDTFCNLWAFASMTANGCLDPLNFKAPPIFLELVSTSNPLIDAQALLARVRAGDQAALRQAIALMEDGLSKRFDEAFDK